MRSGYRHMRVSSRITALLVVILLAACSIPDPTEQEEPNALFMERPAASTTPDAQPAATIPTLAKQPTIAASQPTEEPNNAREAAPRRSATAAETAPRLSATAAPEIRGTITFAFARLPTYFPGIIMETGDLLRKRGYDLQLVPLDMDSQTTALESVRYDKLRSGEWDVMATTLDSLARQSDPQIGAITTLINERAGAEKLIVTSDMTTVNDLQGKQIAINLNDTSHEFFCTTCSTWPVSRPPMFP
ncbi:MAG: hypothetical protein HC828_12950 [Blastochloris sp.]|nr:hypothetical protein [Blastochloris sp.]